MKTARPHFDPDLLFAELERQGRTVKWLARTTRYSRNYLHLIRSREKPLTESVAKAACAAMGIELSSLFLSAEPHKGENDRPLCVCGGSDMPRAAVALTR
jgi:hypothetical protein